MNNNNSKNYPEILPEGPDNKTVEAFIGQFINGVMRSLDKDVIGKYSEIAPGVTIDKIQLEHPNGAKITLEGLAAGVTFTP